MDVVETLVPGAVVVTPRQFSDDRGTFLEWYRFEPLEEVVGRRLDLRQANISVSRRGVFRGLHFAAVPPGQAKYVTVSAGAAIDFFVDVRVGSPTYGRWDSVLLDTVDRRAVFIAEGLAHGFLALEDDTTLTYLVNDVYRPGQEHGIDPMDPAIGLDIPDSIGIPLLSAKDAAAPSLEEAERAGLLPTWDDCVARYAADAR
ncbi:MAG: dTDP-4-dehydrorhamnose 3,5-epimerase [Pseudolysinimonas sp.]|uniref:dTDP-4-dehydrorhamnose 3,5-epimerase family protein n=1 Tax=Pseudolysinimonas sp. TaxID=2680009 RepID=UPI003266E5D8